MSLLPKSASRGSGRTRLGLLLILVVSLGLRLWPIDHGMPANYVPDTHVVKSALGMAQDKTLVPEVGDYSSYPNLLPYLLLPVYAVEFGVGYAAGEWSDAEGFKRTVLEHPEAVHLPARVLVACLSALLPLVAFGAARAMGMGLGAWIAAWLAATGLLGVHFSTQERPWEPMVLFMLLASWPAANYVVHESRKALVLSGAAAGLAFACHQAGAAALLITAVAWLLVAVRNRGDLGARVKPLLVDGVVAVVGFLAVGLLVGHPYLLVHGGTGSDAVVMGDQLEETAGAISIGGQGWVLGLRPESFVRLATALIFYDPVLVLLGLAGLLFAWRKRCMWPALVFLLVWGVVFLFSTNDHVRYLLPLGGLLCLPAGLFVERLAARQATRDGGDGGRGTAEAAPARFADLPRPVAALLVLVLVVPLVQAMRLAHVLDQTDVRAGAAESLVADLPTDAVLAVGRYGPEVPRSKVSLERLADLRTLGSREAHRLLFLRSLAESGHDANDKEIGPPGGAGIDVLYLSDYFDFDDRRGSFHIKVPGLEHLTADELLDQLGVTHLLLADKTPGDGVLDQLVAPEAGWQDPRTLEVGPVPAPLSGLSHTTVWVPGDMHFDSRDPFGADPSGATLEARLPTELDHAGTSIWRVGRPGPALYLFERRPSSEPGQ
ncbi:MAG: glycosyltransferase family 39 protein [Planctomycetota bacterium]|nr:glycosyltransferase family 39 protein [Planctomycetota bacterium]